MKKSCLILGSGRSGTSMVAGMLSKAGFYMGDDLYSPRDSNPKGFFESPVINGINEDLLAAVVPRPPPLFGRWMYRERPRQHQRWLARVPIEVQITCPPRLAGRIQQEVDNKPFCFKDPRFSYTLPAWRPFLSETVFVCVFREPMATAASIVKECRTMPYLRSLKMNTDIAVEVWTLMYQHILRRHRHEGEWLFLHFDQVLQGKGIDRLEESLGASVDRGFPDSNLRRSVAAESPPVAARQTYEELCALAGCQEQ